MSDQPAIKMPYKLYEIKLLKWEQSKTSIRLTFNIIGIDRIDKNDISLQVSKRNLKLNLKESILAGNPSIPFEVSEFFGLVDAKRTVCQRKCENLTVTLRKLEEVKWPSLGVENLRAKRGGKSNNSSSGSVGCGGDKKGLEGGSGGGGTESGEESEDDSDGDGSGTKQEPQQSPGQDDHGRSPFNNYRDRYSQ
jgi:hypothetical protein